MSPNLTPGQRETVREITIGVFLWTVLHAAGYLAHACGLHF